MPVVPMSAGPWMAVFEGDAASLEQELAREVGPGHRLAGRTVRAIARRADQDDVLFELLDSGECAVVHLTWGARPEQPPFPSTRTYPSMEAWRGAELALAGGVMGDESD